MTTDQPDQSLGRRHLLRGGAVLAGAAGLTAIASVTAPTASAADGDPVRLADINSASTRTTIQSNNSGQPTLGLQNDDGPSLYLQVLPSEWNGDLAVGEIANTQYGPMIGVDYGDGDGPQKTFLTTALDIDSLALPIATAPVRVLDTRSAGGRTGIVRRSSTGALDSSGRLTSGSWIDVAVDAADATYSLEAAFLNLTVTGSLGSGFLTAYPPGVKPSASTLNYTKGQTIANGCFVQVGVAGGAFVVRLAASATTHVIADLTGATVAFVPGPAAAVAARTANAPRRRVLRKPLAKLGRSRR